MEITRRRAIGLALGALGGVGLTALAGCSSDDDADQGGLTGESPVPRADEQRTPAPGTVAMFASPSCGCCGEHAEHLRAAGYDVDLTRTDDLATIRADHGVPEEVVGCHLALIDDYVVEGHVPAEAIRRLLDERPNVDGISLPGMPNGSPGMGGAKAGPFEIVTFKGTTTEPFMTV